MSLRDFGLIRKEPTMSTAVRQLKLEEDLANGIGEEVAREYAQPRYRMPPVANIPLPVCEPTELAVLASICRRLVYGDMMQLSRGLLECLSKAPPGDRATASEDDVARAIWDWSTSYEEKES